MKRFRKILYVSENSVSQQACLARAVSLAENNQADLTVIDVIPEATAEIGIPPGGPVSRELREFLVFERRQVLEALAQPYRERFAIQLDVRLGQTFLEVLRAVVHDHYDLVIKPAENPDFLTRIFGSDDMHLLRKCPCPVWLMKAEEKANHERIMAAVDFDPSAPESAYEELNSQIMELSSSLALSNFAELHFVHVWDAPAEMLLRLWDNSPENTTANHVASEGARHQAGMSFLDRRLREQIGDEAYTYLSPRFHSVQGVPRVSIPAMAKQLKADLVVMGTVGRTGIPGVFIGNTAEAILEQLDCSVLAVKPAGFVSPVKLA